MEEILSEQRDKDTEAMRYLVRWEGRAEHENTWEPFENVGHTDAFKVYQQRQKELKQKRRMMPRARLARSDDSVAMEP